jgi:hypothetical protein
MSTTIRQWFNELYDKHNGQYVNLNDKIKAQWPYISCVIITAGYELPTINGRTIWAHDVAKTLLNICPMEDFVVNTHGGELVVGFQDITTAVAVKLQISLNEKDYKVTYGW